MAIRVEAYRSEHEAAVAALNRRLAAGNWPQRFPESSVPTWLPPGQHPELRNELFVAVDGDGEVRGGYILKHQQFVVAGELRSIANYAFPLSEGVIDRRYGLVGVTMILDAQKRNPLLFGLGMGSEAHPSVRVMKGVGWQAAPVPFLFRIVRPYRFLRGMAHLRSSPLRRALLDLAAFSGLGWLAVKAASLPARLGRPRGVAARRVAGFGPWADEIWDAARPKSGIAAVRDAAVLNLLYPASNERYIVLDVAEHGSRAGWAVCVATSMRGSPYFGDLKVGTVVDCCALPGRERVVAAAADAELARRGVDLALSNQASSSWCGALKACGYVTGPTNFIFTCSKPLAALLGPLATSLPASHLNRGDGDGPIHL